ncbi:MAG: sugar ABC transporter substrate-binding protein [Armatimonadetes bacterium]|nr:sugar ABC transporter substrate-binding protein [Armatimonadota bacterium]
MMNTLKVALVGGPMYDRLYDEIPRFRKESGYTVDIGFKAPHPELNEHIAEVYGSGRGDYDLIVTHSKYAPSQFQWLLPLDEYFTDSELEQFTPSTIDLMRIEGRLYQLPRNTDVKVIYYRKDLFEDPEERTRFRARFGYDLAAPKTWDELRDIAAHFARGPELYGYSFPGRYSGLFGSFYELLAMAGGELWKKDLTPGLESPEGEWALYYLKSIYLHLKAAPEETPNMHYDAVASLFCEGRCAIVGDWPGGFYRYRDPKSSKVAGKFGICIYPVGPSGQRWIYSGAFGFAIPKSVRDMDGALRLLRFFTSEECQLVESRQGTIVPRISVQQQAKAECEPGSIEAERLEILGRSVRDHMLIPPKFASYPKVEDALWMSIQSAFIGQVSVKEALAAAAERMRQITAA